MPSSFNRNVPNHEQGRCFITRRLKGLGHDEYQYTHENNVGHTYPTMRCNYCKNEWDLNDEQMAIFIKEEDVKHTQWAEEHRCNECGQSHTGSGMDCDSWKKAGESLISQLIPREMLDNG